MSGSYKRVNFYDLCRLCAQNIQKNKIKIFEQEGVKNQLQSKIKKCLSINIKEDDFLPKVACSKCVKQLELCNAFREECLNSEAMLSSYFKNYRHTEDFKKSGKVYIKDTGKSDMSNESIHIANKKTDTRNNIVTNPKQVTVLKSIINPQKSDRCSKNINNSISKNQNKKNRIEDATTADPINQLQSVQVPYTLDAINEALKKAVQQIPKEILNKVIVNSYGEVINLSPPDSLHMDSSPSTQNIPNGVSSVIKNKSPKKKHVIKQEKSVNQNVVKIDLTDDDHIEEVPISRFNTIPYSKTSQSNNCQTSTPNPTVIFPVPQYQNNNFGTVTTNNIYPQQTTVNIPSSTATVINVICSNAPEQVPSVSSVTQNPPSSINMDDLRSSQNYIPTVPTKTIKTENNKISSSPKVENASKTHACEVCSKTFKRREHLYQHIKLHTGFRPFQCPECKKTFVRKEHLLRHMVLHSGERNFSCDICTKSFSRHDNLLKHIRTHNKEATYTCDICQKVFIVKHYYDTHRSEHGKCFLPPHMRSC